jgi:hypothetical protein
MIHRPAELRVRMQDDRERSVLLRRRMIAAFDPTFRTGENDFRHCGVSTSASGCFWSRAGNCVD